MSLVPMFGASPWDSLRGPLHLFDQNFGTGLDLDDLVAPAPGHLRPGYYRPWRHAANHHGGKSTVTIDKDGFHVMMDVQQFAPEEISVKHVGNHVVVEGKHEEMPDAHGYVSRHFVRRYLLPKNVNADALESTISTDGVLTVTAPKLPTLEEGTARTIPITHTGMPAIKSKAHVVDKHAEAEKPKK
ncbi:protein lethal(2)essential for life-like [Ischnura elegans]|uniref:protein lethal(2)essential for life-like n=1 Tax=Ischnura elegans TaxID=197161 RepID=UPI001ED8B918|nr:protein lethal(2)essential for life-like [Ischnura elegans]